MLRPDSSLTFSSWLSNIAKSEVFRYRLELASKSAKPSYRQLTSRLVDPGRPV